MECSTDLLLVNNLKIRFIKSQLCNSCHIVCCHSVLNSETRVDRCSHRVTTVS